MKARRIIPGNILIFAGLILLITACGQPTPAVVASEIQAVPETVVLVGDTITLNVNVTGEVEGYRWESNLVNLKEQKSSMIIYNAPDIPGTDVIKVFITDTYGREIQKSLVINVVAPTSTPSPVPTSTPTATETPTPTITPTASPSPTPTLSPMVVGSFFSCDGQTDFGSNVGTSFQYKYNVELVATYPEIEDRGCVANLAFNLDAWAGYYMILDGLDLSDYNHLVFEVRSISGDNIPAEIKIDLSRPGQCSSTRVSGVEQAWKTITVPLEQFTMGPCKYPKRLSAWDQMEEIVFVVELEKVGQKGEFQLDNIRFEP